MQCPGNYGVDILIKIRTWLWLNKEKLVLAALVVVLIYQIYKVTNPQERVTVQPPQPPLPRTRVDVDSPEGQEIIARVVEEFPDVDNPPPPPEPVRLPDTSGLVAANPFTVYVGGLTGASRDEEEAEGEPDISLASIQQRPDGTYLAEMRVDGRRSRAEEGEEFGDGRYRLERIDAGNNSVVIYSENHGRRFTFTTGTG